MSTSHGKHENAQPQRQGHYGRLLLMIALSFLAMYALIYSMVDQWANAYNNINQLYMAGLMASPMLLFELWLMSGVYPHRRRNLILAGAAVVFVLFCWWRTRSQAAVTDRQFIRSMISHHAGAVLGPIDLSEE